MSAAIVELLLLVGSLTSFRFVDAPLLEVPFRGATLRTTGFTTCSESRRPTITLARGAAAIEATLVHELAHARDCLDDGFIDGSPLLSDARLAQPSAHCSSNRAEFYACWVTEQAGHPWTSDVHLEAPATCLTPDPPSRRAECGA